MADRAFADLVSLGCHDLRTPLATVNGFAKTLLRSGGLGERETRFTALIDEAAEQMSGLLDELALAARIAAGRYEPPLAEADTLELASSTDSRIATGGRGETIETDAGTMRRSLEALAIAAARHGTVEQVTWTVAGRRLALAPVTADAAPVLLGELPRDLGALVALAVIEHLGGTVAADGGQLEVVL